MLVEDGYEELAGRCGRPYRRLEPGPASAARAPEVDVADDDPLLLIYTSGTTGKPKGALLTHANCFWTNLSFDLATGVRGDDVVLQVLPQFHVRRLERPAAARVVEGRDRRARARVRRRRACSR